MLLIFIFFFLQPSIAQYSLENSEKKRQEKIDYLLNDENSPVKDASPNELHYFDIDSNFCVLAETVILENEKPFRMPTYDGNSAEYIRYAKVRFELSGKQNELTLYANMHLAKNPEYKDYLFLPFNDLTNGELTYGGGRYIGLDKNDIIEGKIKIDFNHVYNPYCAYSNGYRCPVPPKENGLTIGIFAGEKNYSGPVRERPKSETEPSLLTDSEKKVILDQENVLYVLQTTHEQDLTVLKNISADIHWNDPLIITLAEKMLATVQDPANDGVGIAAPQVGINRNFICVQRFDKKENPFEFYINPKITWRSGLLRKGREGCLSIPGFSEHVLRNYVINISYKTMEGVDKSETVEGFTAVIFQHEIDHLYGILFTDRLNEQKEWEVDTSDISGNLFLRTK